jgi:hypothetical protein
MPVPAAQQPGPTIGRPISGVNGPANASADKPGPRGPTLSEFAHGQQSGR